jgi:hypothetical protein
MLLKGLQYEHHPHTRRGSDTIGPTRGHSFPVVSETVSNSLSHLLQKLKKSLLRLSSPTDQRTR